MPGHRWRPAARQWRGHWLSRPRPRRWPQWPGMCFFSFAIVVSGWYQIYICYSIYIYIYLLGPALHMYIYHVEYVFQYLSIYLIHPSEKYGWLSKYMSNIPTQNGWLSKTISAWWFFTTPLKNMDDYRSICPIFQPKMDDYRKLYLLGGFSPPLWKIWMTIEEFEVYFQHSNPKIWMIVEKHICLVVFHHPSETYIPNIWNISKNLSGCYI